MKFVMSDSMGFDVKDKDAKKPGGKEKDGDHGLSFAIPLLVNSEKIKFQGELLIYKPPLAPQPQKALKRDMSMKPIPDGKGLRLG